MIPYNADNTRNFYDAYGSIEWDRLEATAYGRLKAIIHADFIGRYVASGDRAGFPSTQVGMLHPPMHLFTSEELRGFLPGCEVLEIAGSNVTAYEGSTAIEEVFDDPQAWETAVRLERELNGRPGLVDTGSHIIMAARRTEQ